MVYNHLHNFLFVHIQKNAGTAITQALLKIPGSEFIAPAHMRLRDLKFDADKKPFVFAVIRNPWSRLVSWYEMMIRKGIHNDFSRYLLSNHCTNENPISFSRFIRRIDVIQETSNAEMVSLSSDTSGSISWRPDDYVKSLAFNQVDYLINTHSGIACDMYLSFENLHRDWKLLITELDLDQSLLLKQQNSNPHLVDYLSYFKNQADLMWVADLYKQDIEAFGFSFQSSATKLQFLNRV
jgi:hypothetical protein